VTQIGGQRIGRSKCRSPRATIFADCCRRRRADHLDARPQIKVISSSGQARVAPTTPIGKPCGLSFPGQSPAWRTRPVPALFIVTLPINNMQCHTLSNNCCPQCWHGLARALLHRKNTMRSKHNQRCVWRVVVSSSRTSNWFSEHRGRGRGSQAVGGMRGVTNRIAINQVDCDEPSRGRNRSRILERQC